MIFDIVYVMAVVAGPFIALALAAVTIGLHPSKKVRAAAIVLAATSFAAFVTYRYAWGLGFDDADAGRPVSPTVDVLSNASIVVSLATLVLLITVVATTYIRRPRLPSNKASDSLGTSSSHVAD